MKFILYLFALMLTVSTASADEPRKIALLVGVSDYESRKVDDLKFAENDIRVVGSQLKLMGFEVSSLTGEQATRDQAISTIDDFMEKASELETSDIVFVMFSGHGQQIRVSDGSKVREVPYFCPADSLPFDESKFSTRGKSESDVAEELNFVSLNRVLRGLDEYSNSLNNLLVVDACRNNPSKGKSAGISGTSATVPQGVNIIFAAGSGQKSWESADKEIEHGVFTHFLIKGLQGDARNSRDQVTWSRLASYLQDEVAFSGPSLAGGKNRLQNPHSIINSTNLIVLGKATSDEWIEDRLYELLRNPKDMLGIAELCREKDFVITPVYAAMLLADEEDCKKGWEILEPHFGSPELISLILNPVDEFRKRSKAQRQLSALDQLIQLSLAKENYEAVSRSAKKSESHLNTRLVRFASQVSRVQNQYLFASGEDRDFADWLKRLDDERERLKDEWESISREFKLQLDSSTIAKFNRSLTASAKFSAIQEHKDLMRKRMIGKPFPTISGKDLEGNSISTNDFKGKVVIVGLWDYR